MVRDMPEPNFRPLKIVDICSAPYP
jgi:hypothetical protein